MVESPCVDICRLSETHAVCIGCYRTLDEIARWRDMSDAERTALLATLVKRRGRLGALVPDGDPRAR